MPESVARKAARAPVSEPGQSEPSTSKEIDNILERLKDNT
jgi:hypothetical protein